MNDVVHWMIEGAIGLFGSIVVYFLHRRDELQQKQFADFKESINSSIVDTKEQITDLYGKHSTDADRLHGLELDVAKNFFTKDEIKKEFEDQKKYFDGRFDRIERLLDERRK